MSKKLGLHHRSNDVFKHLHCSFDTRHLLDAKIAFAFLFSNLATAHLRGMESKIKDLLKNLALIERTFCIGHKIKGHTAGFEHQTLCTATTTATTQGNNAQEFFGFGRKCSKTVLR